MKPTVKDKESGLFTKMALGGVACITAATVTHPIDLIKTRMQANYASIGISMQNSSYNTLKKTVKNEGIRSLYKGLSAAWLREASYSSTRLGLYEPFKKLLGATDREHTPFYIMALSGALSGMVASGIFNPADMLKVRMQVLEQHSHSLWWHVKDIYVHNGIFGFYRGVEATMSRAIVANAVQMPAYDYLKHKLINIGVFEDNHLCHLVCSFAAGFILTLVTGPFDVARTRMMNQPSNQKLYSNMFECLWKSIQREGFKSLYKGFTPQWLRFGPFTIVQCTVWEGLRSHFGLNTI